MRRNVHVESRDEQCNDDNPLVFKVKRSQQGNISCEELMDLNPSRCGYCYKKNNSFLAYLFPCLYDQWKKRYFVLIGNYLFRFSSEQSDSIKGVPLPLDCITASYIGDGVFQVSMIRKIYLMRCENEKEAIEWVNSINLRKLEAIKEGMGHSPLDASTRRINKLADYIFNTRLQADRKQAEEIVRNPMDGGSVPF